MNMLHATEPHVGKRAAFMVCAVYHHVKNWGSKAATQQAGIIAQSWDGSTIHHGHRGSLRQRAGFFASHADSFPGDVVFALCIQDTSPGLMKSPSVMGRGEAGCRPPNQAGRPEQLLTLSWAALCRAVVPTGTILWGSFN